MPARDRERLQELFTNDWLWAAIGPSAKLQAAVVLNLAFGTVPLTLAQWLQCISMASMVLWFSEGRKALSRWWGGRRSAVA